MMDGIDISLINWSRGQFALTAIYHWLFVPLTLGLSFIIAFMETIYVRTGKEEWKRITKFWMTLFGINFAIGVATGIILEFEFGTNWSNYSWFVGDIFGAPLAIEGIMAFFLESTFIAVMFFGWNKVSKKFHLLSTWLVAFGASLSGLWILVANAWMQYPVGMQFNPDTARNEMLNFLDVFLSPVAINKFIHTITSGFVLGSIFVIGISSWFLLKKREIFLAKRSIIIASVFGITSSIVLISSGDSSTRQIAEIQPMKLAALEGLYEGKDGTGLILFGVLNKSEEYSKDNKTWEYKFKIEIPKLLSYMARGNPDAFVPGVNDLIKGNPKNKIISAQEKIERGRYARDVLAGMKEAKENGNIQQYEELKSKFYNEDFKKNYFKYFGYGFLNNTNSLIPNVPMTFYSFHVMVMLGFYFFVFFVIMLVSLYRGKIDRRRWLLRLAVITIPFAYIASQAGWIVSEMGRQPWVVQDLLPTVAATSYIDASTVQVTFWIFAVLFTALLAAEIKIMFKQIKTGPKPGGK
ncbi:MAG: cytochrome ubiquinol oxidase subunit I [Bacteroidales bacterium]|nr:MAG: cytochrome ubiquinol oxidase subunit I [Bacteroidales bacterium]